MQIEFENLSNDQFISSFGENYIVINNKKCFKNSIIFKNNILQNINEELLFSSDFIKKKLMNLISTMIILLYLVLEKIFNLYLMKLKNI